MVSIDKKDNILKRQQSFQERKYIDEYLRNKGYHLGELNELPREEARKLMVEACTHVSLKFAEFESKAKFREKIQYK